MQDFRTEIITSNDGLERLRTEWDRIHACSRLATPFNTWAWMATWWQIFGRRRWRLHIVCIYSDGKLIGIVPLYRRRSWHGWTLRFLGTGEDENDEVVTEYCDFLVEAQAEPMITGMGWHFLIMAGGWSDFRTCNVLSDSIISQTRADSVVRTSCGARYRMPLPQDWSDFLSGCSSNMRRQIRLAERDAAQAETSEEVIRDWNAGGADAFNILGRLHQLRWQDKNAPGAFSSTLFRDFHREIVSQYAEETGSEIRIIRSSGEPVAALYNFRLRDTVYFYQSGVSPVAHFRSPGVYSHCKAIKSAIDDGIAFYDMMRGDLSSYKKRFPCEITEMQNISLFRSSYRARLFVQTQNFVRWLRSSIMSKQNF